VKKKVFVVVVECNVMVVVLELVVEVVHCGGSCVAVVVVTVEPSGVHVLKNPNPLKDVEASAMLDVVVLV